MIRIESLSKNYGSKQALSDVNIEIKRGEIIGLLGLNGAGKSTMMNIIAGCLAKSEGKVEIDGIDVEKDPIGAKKKIGYLPEIPPLYVDMTVEEYLRFVARLKKIKGRENEDRELERVLEKAGLVDVSKRIIKNLSKGYRQRVGVAQALLGDPEIFILDEPTVGLDPTQIIEIKNLICDLGKDKTVILSSHILSQISSVARRVIVINQGRVIADDTPENLEKKTTGKNVCKLVCEGEEEKLQIILESMAEVANLEIEKVDGSTIHAKFEWKESTELRRKIFNEFVKNDFVIISMEGETATLEDVFVELLSKKEEEE